MTKPIEIWPENVERAKKVYAQQILRTGGDPSVRAFELALDALCAPKPEKKTAWPMGTKFKTLGYTYILASCDKDRCVLVSLDSGGRFDDSFHADKISNIELPADFLALNPVVVED